MARFFVNKTDRVSVDVYVWEEDGNVRATHERDQIPADTEVETVTFRFQRPTYSDSTDIFRQSQLGSLEGVDVSSFQDLILRQLCKEWTLTDQDGKPVPVNNRTIGNLEPAIARAAVEGVLQKIRL